MKSDQFYSHFNSNGQYWHRHRSVNAFASGFPSQTHLVSSLPHRNGKFRTGSQIELVARCGTSTTRTPFTKFGGVHCRILHMRCPMGSSGPVLQFMRQWAYFGLIRSPFLQVLGCFGLQPMLSRTSQFFIWFEALRTVFPRSLYTAALPYRFKHFRSAVLQWHGRWLRMLPWIRLSSSPPHLSWRRQQASM